MSEGQQQTAQLSKIHRRMKKEEAPGILISKIRGIPTTDRQAGSAGSVTDILTRIRENKEKPSPDKQTPAAIDKAPLRDRMSRVRFGRPATARQAESEISAQHIEALRLWSNITGIQIEFLARNDNLKKVQHRANIISLKQQQEKEWRKAADRMPGDMYREAVQRDTAPLASEQETKRARTVGSAPAVYHKDQGIQGYDPSADGTDTSPYPHILPEVENLYTPFKGILQQRYEEALKGANQSKVLGKERAGYTALQTALLIPALAEEIVSGVLNAPDKAAIAGQYAARFDLTGDYDDRDKAAGSFTQATLDASPLTGLKAAINQAGKMYTPAITMSRELPVSGSIVPEEGVLKIPQGLSKAEFDGFSRSLKSVMEVEKLPVGKTSVHGSRASGGAVSGSSDIDILHVVSDADFEKLVAKRLAETTGRIKKLIQKNAETQQRINARGISRILEKQIWETVYPVLPKSEISKIQFSIVKESSPFNKGPFICLE